MTQMAGSYLKICESIYHIECTRKIGKLSGQKAHL